MTNVKQKPLSFADTLCFAIPALMWAEVQVVGRLFVPELVLAALLLPLLSQRGSALLRRYPRSLIMLALAWLGSQVLTDVARSTPQVDFLRGWAKIAFTILDFAALYLLIGGSERRIINCVTGLACGQIIGFVVAPTAVAREYPWKFGVGYAVTLLLIVVAQKCYAAGKESKASAVVAFAGMLSLALAFRSLAVSCFATFGYLLAAKGVATPRNAGGLRNTMRLGLSLGVPLLVCAQAYTFAAGSGRLGEDARVKYEQQSAGDLGVLVGGRQEMLASTQAIMDSPILGHGSWAKDPQYAELLTQRLVEYGYAIGPSAEDNDLIPSHSHLLGAWVEAGIVGAVFWLWFAWMIATTLVLATRAPIPLLPILAFVGLDTLWSICFSPFGAEARMALAFAAVLIIHTRHKIEAVGRTRRVAMRGV